MAKVELDQDQIDSIALNFTHIDFCSDIEAAWIAVEALILSVELDHSFVTIFDGLLADKYAKCVYAKGRLGADENDYKRQLANLSVKDGLRVHVLNLRDRSRDLLHNDLTPLALTVSHILDGHTKAQAIDAVLRLYSDARHGLPEEVRSANLTNTSWRTVHRKWRRFEGIIPYLFMYFLFKQSYLDEDMGRDLDWFNEFPCRAWATLRHKKLLENKHVKSVFLRF